MRILLADDERPARSELRSLLEELSAQSVFVEAASGEEAIDSMSKMDFDVLFVDMDLGDMLGTTVASAASRLQPEVPVIFATAYSDYAIRAFELGALDYILKPFDPKRVAQAIERIRDGKIQKPEIPKLEKLPVNCDKKTILLPFNEVLYIETRSRGSTIHAKGGVYESGASIGSLEQRLAGCPFFRIHKSYLVNLTYVSSIFTWKGGSYALTIEGCEKDILPIGRPQFKILRTMFSI